MGEGKGFLLAMMEPPPALTEEFNEWYDTEHIPQRQAVKGFNTALRFVCTEGWPRYLAIYDLDSLEVLDDPDYKAVAGDNFSPWSRRVLTKVSGQWRFGGTQIYPGDGITGAYGALTSLLLIRWRGAKAEWKDTIVSGLRRNFEGKPGIDQVRAFSGKDRDSLDFIGVIDATLPPTRASIDLTAFGESARGIDLINLYAPYWRRISAHSIYK
jgi:hypothetical protein